MVWFRAAYAVFCMGFAPFWIDIVLHAQIESKRVQKRRFAADDLPQFVAIKKIRVTDSSAGLSMEAIREIKIMQELNHPNVVRARINSLFARPIKCQ